MKPHQQPLLDLHLGRKLKKKLPLKVIRLISELQQENQKLSLQLLQECSSKKDNCNQLFITQLQAENERLKNQLSRLITEKV